MTTNPNITMSIDEILRATVDDLGALRSRIAALQAEAREIENLLKIHNVDALDGHHYRVTISYSVETRRVDWKSVAAKLKPSHQLVSAHTHTSKADRVRVTALKKTP